MELFIQQEWTGLYQLLIANNWCNILIDLKYIYYEQGLWFLHLCQSVQLKYIDFLNSLPGDFEKQEDYITSLLISIILSILVLGSDFNSYLPPDFNILTLLNQYGQYVFGIRGYSETIVKSQVMIDYILTVREAYENIQKMPNYTILLTLQDVKDYWLNRIPMPSNILKTSDVTLEMLREKTWDLVTSGDYKASMGELDKKIQDATFERDLLQTMQAIQYQNDLNKIMDAKTAMINGKNFSSLLIGLTLGTVYFTVFGWKNFISLFLSVPLK